MIRIENIKIRSAEGQEGVSPRTGDALMRLLCAKAAGLLRIRDRSRILSCGIAHHAIDARKKPDIFDVYHLDVALRDGELAEEKLVSCLKKRNVRLLQKPSFSFPEITAKKTPAERLAAHGHTADKTIVVGSGPAGLFAAYDLAMRGEKVLLIERGKRVEERVRDVLGFWSEGVLLPSSNAQFGEGGAGTFSDGKLYTSVRDREGFFSAILKTFVLHGAPKEILYEAHPHLGTDRLTAILKSMRERMLEMGADIRFETTMTGLIPEGAAGFGKDSTERKAGSPGQMRRISGIRTDRGEIEAKRVILAIGHSARDTYEALLTQGVAMEAKAFAAGFRIAHPQTVINAAMYGVENPKTLPPAHYKLTCTTSAGRQVYSFCMCPGGYVINASSEEGALCVNGMSYADRGGRFANSAIVAGITPADVREFTESREQAARPDGLAPQEKAGEEHVLSGREILAGALFQRHMEQAAFMAGEGAIPVSALGAFRRDVQQASFCGHLGEGRARQDAQSFARGRVLETSLAGILPSALETAILEGIRHFGTKISGFDAEDALLFGVESRTSAPVRIVRGADFQSVNTEGLFPCGEGAGYAGGIMSAAADGLRVAMRSCGSPAS